MYNVTYKWNRNIGEVSIPNTAKNIGFIERLKLIMFESGRGFRKVESRPDVVFHTYLKFDEFKSILEYHMNMDVINLTDISNYNQHG